MSTASKIDVKDHVADQDHALRPVSLADYVGQPDLVRSLSTAIGAARAGGWALDHALISGPPGTGKCLGAGTPVLLADGHVRSVEHIVVGDRLMGPDGRARTVLSTTSGRAPLFRINPLKGEPWVCNDVHVLTLVHSGTDEIIDIPLDQFLQRGKSFRHHLKQFSVAIDTFECEPAVLPIDPYFLGLWFGDGTKQVRQQGLTKIAITKPDPEVLAACEAQAKHWGLQLRTFTSGGTRCPTYQFSTGERGGVPNNRMLCALRDLVGPDIMMPTSYTRASREVRLQLLAGICDADAELSEPSTFIITQKREDWAREIWWMARSLGFSATLTTKHGSYKRSDGSMFESNYWSVYISGDTDQIPTRLPRKKARPRTQKKVVTRTGFSVEPIGDGAYYGFTLDGDGRFLLGDFTVTHNTSIARVIAHELGGRLVIVHAPAITNKGELCAVLVGLGKGDVLFIDEVHALPVKVQECLYAAMEDFRLDLPAGKGSGAKVISLPLPRFTLVAATTRVGVLAKPLVDRFGLHFQLRPYDVTTLAQIVVRSAGKLGLAVEPDAAVEIARRSRGTPRIANKLLRRVRDHAAVTAAKGALVPAGVGTRLLINLPITVQALDDLGVDAAGLEALDREYLAALAARKSPVGVEAIAAALATEAATLEESVEPLLLQLGLIARTPRGRVATDAGREHLGLGA